MNDLTIAQGGITRSSFEIVKIVEIKGDCIYAHKNWKALCLPVICDETTTALLTHPAIKDVQGVEDTAFLYTGDILETF